MEVATRIFKTAEFAKFSAKSKISDATLREAIERVERGLVDADLGDDILKLRVARPNEGRRAGYRTIVACVVDKRAFFLYGFGKNDRANIDSKELNAFRRLANVLQGFDEASLAHACVHGELLEIER